MSRVPSGINSDVIATILPSDTRNRSWFPKGAFVLLATSIPLPSIPVHPAQAQDCIANSNLFRDFNGTPISKIASFYCVVYAVQ